MDIPKINLHIHSIYSDGRNKIETIVKRANKLNLRFIAITDHFSNSWKAGVIKTLDSHKKIKNYLEKISDQNKELQARGSNLRVLKGIEIDLGSSRRHIESLINPSKFDLILLEYLHSPETIGFVRNFLKDWEIRIQKQDKSFPLLGLAHFDPSQFIYSNVNLLLDFLQKHNIYFEFNSAYSSYYSVKYKESFFDKFNDFNILVGIGADAHSVNELDLIHEPLDMIKYYNLENNLRNLIELLKQID
jgi:histidinol phosphatase-like PHP family hydrolase